jgi:hypothetical protein
VGCAPSDIYHDVDWAGHPKQMKIALHFTDQMRYWGFPWDINRSSGYDYPDEVHEENTIVNYFLTDQNLLRPQEFAIVDGLVGIKQGPVADPTAPGTKVTPNMQMVIAGADSVAVDTVSALLMTYDPEYVRHLRWSYNRELGTMRRSRITVVGEKVMDARREFEDDWQNTHAPNGQRVETVPPTMSGVNPTNGSAVSGVVTIEPVNPADNVGVVKSEVKIEKVYDAADDLLVNGDFETGDATGWTEWSAPWGSSITRDYANGEPGHAGAYCLKLGHPASTGSYGVYQEVSVTPGQTYQMDALWRGEKMGDWNWFEILVLDGPWDYDQADGGDPPTEVEPNYMWAYDNNTYGLKGPTGTTFGWIQASDQNGTPVDWNHRHGQITASGSTLTVVLKAGACCGTSGIAAWFDNVTLVEVDDRFPIFMSNDQAPFDFEWITPPDGDGDYDITMTIYDAGLNHAEQTNRVTLLSDPAPWIDANPLSFDLEVDLGTSPLDGTLEISNLGQEAMDYTVTLVDPGDSWVTGIVPPSGTSTGPLDPQSHMIEFDTTGLAPGSHAAELRIDGESQLDGDPALNSPVIVPVTVNVKSVMPDFDVDGDVDMDDYAFLQNCFSEQGGSPPPAGCEAAVLDGDVDVDAGDVGVFLMCLSGADVWADGTCDDAFEP